VNRDRRSWVLPALVAVFVAGCAGPPKSDGDEAAAEITQGTDDEQAVLAELREYYADFTDRDWERFASHFWPGATMTTVWPPPGETVPRVVITTVPEFVRMAPQGPGSRSIFQEEMTDAKLRVEGDLAMVWADYEAVFGEPGDVITWTGIDAFTLMRHDGRWRIVSLAYVVDESE
jgi:hypothetical protein